MVEWERAEHEGLFAKLRKLVGSELVMPPEYQRQWLRQMKGSIGIQRMKRALAEVEPQLRGEKGEVAVLFIQAKLKQIDGEHARAGGVRQPRPIPTLEEVLKRAVVIGLPESEKLV